MKNLIIISTILFSFPSFCQVGINTTSPKATFDVVGNSIDIYTVDGIIAPRISGDELKLKDAIYGINQRGVILYVTSLPSPSTLKTTNINEIGYYYFDGDVWLKLSYKNISEIGDIKDSFKDIDHNGWIKLDGRSIANLTVNQQLAAISLGFSSNIPNANDKILIQGGILGSTSYASPLSQNQLPNVFLSGITDIDGSHTHSIDPLPIISSSDGNHTHGSNAPGTQNNYGLVKRSAPGQNVTSNGIDSIGSGSEPNIVATPIGLSINTDGIHTHIIDIPSTNSSLNGSHDHTFVTTSINGNTPQLPIDTNNFSRLYVNKFLYLGL